MSAIVETRNIKLPKGGVLEVEMTSAFVDKLRKHFGLMDDEMPNDDMVRMFVWGAVNTAVNKAESDNEQQTNVI